MSNIFVTTRRQHLDVKPSWLLAIFLLIQEGFVFYALWLLPILTVFKLFGTVGLVFMTLYNLRLFALQISDKSIVHLIEQSNAEQAENKLWELIQRNGKIIEADLMGETYNSTSLIVLLFKQEEKRWPFSIRAVILIKDNLDEISWRRLRAYLTRIKMKGLKCSKK